jgi:cellulose synthase operon protein C
MASGEEDYRAAADHFLRIRTAAPTSAIRASAEYDAGAALIRLEDWTAAVQVLDAFRRTFPEHELQLEAAGRSPTPTGRTASCRAPRRIRPHRLPVRGPGLRGEALLLAGDLYEQSQARDRALDAYIRYVDEFPRPVETAVETRFKIAGDAQGGARRAALSPGAGGDRPHRRGGRRRNGPAAPGRSRRVRPSCSRSSASATSWPCGCGSRSRSASRRSSGAWTLTIEAMGRLVEYEIADVTAAATYYMAETYSRLQPLADGVGAAGRPGTRGAGGVRAGPRRGGVSVRGAGHRRPREEHGTAAGRRLQRVDREEPRTGSPS